MPIFVIDEANELSALTKDPNGHDTILNLFKWLILNNKELGRFHTILSVAIAFFICGYRALSVLQGTYANYVIGDLTKESAEEFWLEKLLPVIQDKKISLPNFNEIYKVCGGNMLLLKRMLWEHILAEGRINPDDFLWLYKNELN